MSGKLGAANRQLDFFLSQPVGASDDLLKAELTAYSPWLAPKSRGVRLSNMRKCVDPLVRANVATLAAWAARRTREKPERYAHEFLKAATAIRRGETLR